MQNAKRLIKLKSGDDNEVTEKIKNLAKFKIADREFDIKYNDDSRLKIIAKKVDEQGNSKSDAVDAQ